MRIDYDIFVHNNNEKNTKMNLINKNKKLKTKY